MGSGVSGIWSQLYWSQRDLESAGSESAGSGAREIQSHWDLESAGSVEWAGSGAP